MALSKTNRRQRIHNRVRRKVKGTPSRPRLAVYRSNKAIYCQLIDDSQGITLSHANSLEDAEGQTGNKIEIARAVGQSIASKAKDINVESVVFDRGGYLFHGRVKALADGAREGGLKF